VLLFLIGSNVYSQTPGLRKVYSLDECLDIALRQNPDIILAEAGLSPAEAAVTNAFGQFLPSANFNWGYTRQLNAKSATNISLGGISFPIPAEPNSYNMNLIGNYTIFNGFSREATYSQSKLHLESANLNLSYTKEMVKINIHRVYNQVIKNMQIVKTRNENIQSGNKELERTNAQFQAGVAQKGQVYAQEADLGTRELDLVNSENILNKSKAQLLVLMGMNPDVNVDFLESSLKNRVSEDEIKKFDSEVGTVNDAVKKALENRFDYHQYKTNLSAAQKTITVSTSGYFPTVSANGGWTWSNSAFNSFGELGRTYIGLNLSLPIFDNFTTNYQIENSKLQVKQAEIALFNLEQNIKSAMQSAMLDLQAAEKSIDITDRSLKSAQLNYESFKERFDVGAASVTDYLNANTLLITNQINRINAIYDYYQAQKEVLFVMGTL
jgi:outer membrane protein